MTDYGEQGATPVDDAAVDDPPTVDEVMEAQRREHPEQAATSTMATPAHAPADAPPPVSEPDGAPATDAGDDHDDDGGASPAGP
jgi:hypothetical protein